MNYEFNGIFLTVHGDTSVLYRPGDDLSGLPQVIQDAAELVWTPEVIADYQSSFTIQQQNIQEQITDHIERVENLPPPTPDEVNVTQQDLDDRIASLPTIRGPKGDKGDKGDPGPRGPAGQDGDRGPKGDKGDTGPRGPAGQNGTNGSQGPKGDKGDRGSTGPKGDTGSRGPTGPVGPPGVIREYVSGHYGLARNGRYVLNHGLGAVPDNVQIYLYVASNTWGHPAGTYIPKSIGWNSDAENSKGFEMYMTTTQIVIKQGYDWNSLGILDMNNGHFRRIDGNHLGRFRLHVRAQRFN